MLYAVQCETTIITAISLSPSGYEFTRMMILTKICNIYILLYYKYLQSIKMRHSAIFHSIECTKLSTCEPRQRIIAIPHYAQEKIPTKYFANIPNTGPDT